MYSDGQLSPIGESSVPVPNRMLRRLKKAETISDLFPGSETLDSKKAGGEDFEKPMFQSPKDFDRFEEEDGPRSDLENLGVEDGVTARKVLDFDSVPEFNTAFKVPGEKAEDEIFDLETSEEIRVSEMKEARNERLVFETSVLDSNPAVDLSEKGEEEISDLETREEIRISETKEATSVPDSDSAFEELGEKGEEDTRDVEIGEETSDSEANEAGMDRPGLETSVPESNSEFEELGEKGEEEIHDVEMGEEIKDWKTKKARKKRPVRETSDSEEKERKGRKKRNKKSADFDELPVSTASMNMTKKERREYLDQLRAENQRLLRETRDAAFEPVPLVRKPISSVLEKIRRRKEEISKQFLSRKKSKSVDISDSISRENASDDLSEEVVPEEKNENVDIESTNKQNPGGQNCMRDSADPSGNSDSPSNKKAESNSTHQAPSLPSQTTNSGDEVLEKTSHRSLEEVMTPSVLAMNLKMNSSPARDDSSEEAEYNKENCDPETHDSSPGDPVRKFIDEDAEEEDDSDNDLLRFEDEDEEDDEEDDDLKDMIASQFKEDPSDKERRNELHQKWLEEQDAAGTEKLLQKLKRGLQEDKTSLSEDDDDDVDADDEERAEDANDEEVEKPEASEDVDDEEDPSHAQSMRMTIKKIKEMIPLMFTDEDDVYVSSDDEEMEKKLQQQRLYKKMELKNKLSSPTEEEDSEEIFRRIKKTEIKKKTKPSSFKDKVLMGINKNPAASKSSFLGRLKKSSISEGSRKRGSNIVRGYIFERDDSNSRSSISLPEEPTVSEKIIEEKSRPKRAPAKFTASQSQERSSTVQATAVEEEKSSRQRATLYEILKMSSKKSCFASGETVISSSHTESIFAAFKLDKKPV